MRFTNKRFMGLAALCGAVASVAGAMPFTGMAHAAAPPALYKTSSLVVEDNSSTKTTTAFCNGNDEVVGGGAWAFDNESGQVRLTGLEPTAVGSFIATAEAPPGFDDAWWLQAYAICAPAAQVPGHRIAKSDAVFDTPENPFLQVTVSCGDQRAVGTGSRISAPNRHVGLQLNRPSGPMDIARSTAREDDGHAVRWSLTSFAVCVNGEANQHVDGTLPTGAYGEATCGDDASGNPTFVHSVGGGGGTSDSGRSWLQMLYPFGSLRRVGVGMTAPNDSGGLSVGAVCAN